MTRLPHIVIDGILPTPTRLDPPLAPLVDRTHKSFGTRSSSSVAASSDTSRAASADVLTLILSKSAARKATGRGVAVHRCTKLLTSMRLDGTEAGVASATVYGRLTGVLLSRWKTKRLLAGFHRTSTVTAGVHRDRAEILGAEPRGVEAVFVETDTDERQDTEHVDRIGRVRKPVDLDASEHVID